MLESLARGSGTVSSVQASERAVAIPQPGRHSVNNITRVAPWGQTQQARCVCV